jgi:hypothetical protein
VQRVQQKPELSLELNVSARVTAALLLPLVAINTPLTNHITSQERDVQSKHGEQMRSQVLQQLHRERAKQEAAVRLPALQGHGVQGQGKIVIILFIYQSCAIL